MAPVIGVQQMQHSSCSSSSFSAGHARAFRFRLEEGVAPTPTTAALIGEASLLEPEGAGDAIKAAIADTQQTTNRTPQ